MAEERWLTQDDVAELLGHASQRTVAHWRSAGLPKHNPLPAPDEVRAERGHARPVWREATIRAWLERRPGRGRRVKPSEEPEGR